VAGRTGGRALNAQIALRAGGPQDRAFVLDLGRRTAVDSVSALRRPPLAFVEASYERLIDFAFDGSYVLLIAESSLDGPRGFVLMLDTLPDEVTGMPQGFVAYMAVEPDARRRGIGARLLAAAEEAARAKGLPYLALMVTEDNLAARELYAQAGFSTERRLLCKPL
jgi:ribosomal protein S18 acetylase RimI-like enzyme